MFPTSLRDAMRGVDAVLHISPHEAVEVELLRRPPADFTEFVRRIVAEHGLAPATATGADGIPPASQTEGALR